MKSKYISILAMIFIFALVPTWILAATMNNLAGSWDVQVSEKFTVQKLGKDTGDSTGTVNFIEIDNLNGTFSHDNDENGYIYTGTCSLDNKGRKLSLSLDSNGLAEIKDMLESWIIDWVEWEGAEVTNVSFDFQKVTYTKATISRKTNAPNKATMKVKGKVSGLLTDDRGTKYITVNFTYTAKIIFILKNP
jgi:hypothetical protein